MKTLQDSKHYETLKRLHPEAVRLGFVGEWEEIESSGLHSFNDHDEPNIICDWDMSGVAGRYLTFLYVKMNIKNLNKIPEKYNKQRDYVFVDGEMYYIGERYWFSDDGKKWHEFEFTGFDRDSQWPWKCPPSICRHISKTKPDGPTPEQIKAIKCLYPESKILERNNKRRWYVRQADGGLISSIIIPDSQNWPDGIYLSVENE